MKKRLALFLSLALIVSFAAGCSASEPAESTAPSVASTPASSSSEAASGSDVASDSVPLSLDFLIVQQAGAPLSADVPVMKELAARTNTVLTFNNIAAADMPTRIQTLIAAEQLPDVVEYYQSADSAGTNVMTYLDNGTFLYLNDYISESATPNLWKVMQDNPAYAKDISTDAGGIMGIAQLVNRKWRCDWVVNNSFLTELGMEAPTDVDSFYDYLVAVKEKYPDAIPLGVGPYNGGANAVKMPIMYMFNVTKDFWLYNDDQYLFGPWEKQQEYSDALRFINTLYNEKLIDQEFFSRDDESTNASISNNLVGMLYGWADGYGQWGKTGSWGIDMIPNPPIAGPDGVAHARGNARQAVTMNVITNVCPDVPRTMAFYDYIMSEEGAELLNWGIEGTDHNVVNGEREYTDLIMKHEQGYVMGRYLQGIAHPKLPTILDNAAELKLNGPETALHEEYLSQSTLFPFIPLLTPTPEEDEQFSSLYPDILTVIDTYEAELIQGSAEEFDATFAEFMQALEDSNVQAVCDIKRAQYDRYKNR